MGHFVSTEPLACADDVEAIKQALPLANGHTIEIWRGDRLVKRLEAKPK
jgi:hypothetical protein